MSLVLALPSKGRLKEQTEVWLADCGLNLRSGGGARGYQASIEDFEGVEARLAPAAEIAQSLALGEIHLGVTGEDLLGETGGGFALLLALGFGRADLVAAAPRSWIDVETMADLCDVAHDILARTGRRLRVATKYAGQTRAFFAAQGLADYRIVESGGATEGAPAAGLAELVVDITTTGATLAANGLKPISDGLILKSQARLAASLHARWDAAALAAASRLLRVMEARALGRMAAALTWPEIQDDAAREVAAAFTRAEDSERANGALIPLAELPAAMDALAAAGVGPVSVTRPTYVFHARCQAAEALARALNQNSELG